MSKKKPDVAQLIATYSELEQRRVDLVEQQEAIKAQLRDQLQAGKHETDAGTVTISPNRRFDPALAAKVLAAVDPDLVAKCSVTKVDSSATKRHVGDDVYAACMKDLGTSRVVISS